MKKNKIQYALSLLLVFILSLCAVIPLQRGESDRSDWMAALDDGASLRSLTIPGTHDSGALHSIADVSGKCQTLSIGEQLKIGVRFLDIRLQLVDNEFKVVHSFVDQMTDFEDVLNDMTEFIRNNESEFLIVSIKEDASPKRSDQDFAAALEALLLSYSEVRGEGALPETVGAARGGIHIIARYRDAAIGLPCYAGWEDDAAFSLGDIYVQDNYRDLDSEDKINSINEAFNYALNNSDKLVINFTSCYYDSGFPPTYAGTAGRDINPWLLESLQGGSGRVGIIVADFITDDLAKAIYGRNF